ncbi:TPM domain-containing protein [Peptoniphilus catoniae]|uniref:TPM domain-containing protein n=1 Tax=Peptoniphilus catoniae TaxID=1660341 RepID=UPI0015D61D79|nr:TPM domain-containing protein [Peptoniphilus catoniae]
MRRKKVFSLIIAMLFFFTSSIFAKSLEELIPDPAEASKNVYDELGILNSDTIEYMNNTNSDLQSKTGGQIVVVVVKSLDGYSIEEYSTKLFEKWKIGDSKELNGSLLLFAIDDHKMRIENGYGTEGFIPDAYSSRIIRNIAEVFTSDPDKGKFNEGILEGYNEVLQYYADEYNVEIENKKDSEFDYADSEDEIYVSDIMRIIFIMIIIIIIFSGPRRGSRYRRRRFPFYGGGFFGGGSSGGGFSGGGFSSGGFSGGGGRSGGGGASGGW